MLNSKSSLITRFDDQPSLVAPEAVGHLSALLASIPLTSVSDTTHEDLCAAAFGFAPAGTGQARKPFAFADGLAFIGVYGMLLHRYSWCDDWATGYDNIRMKYEAALADQDVKGIVFDINSPGGQVAGNFELVDMIYGARDRKKTLALVDGSATSGAYSIASGAHKIVASPSSRAGSIGVVMMHASYQKYMEEAGIGITFIYAGKHKIDGNAYQDLPAEVRDRYQASVDKSYTAFVNLVSRNRGLDADAVRATEALVYDAEEAKRVGLIDAISQPDRAIAAFRKELSGSTTQGGFTMSTTNQPEANATAGNEPAATPAPVDTAAIVAAERSRVAAILNSEEAVGREELARHFVESGLEANAAIAALSKAPKAAPASAATVNPLEAAMAAVGTPNVGAGADVPVEMSDGDRIVKNAEIAFGTRKTH